MRLVKQMPPTHQNMLKAWATLGLVPVQKISLALSTEAACQQFVTPGPWTWTS